MIDAEKLKRFLELYKSRFLKIWKDEKYKWEAVKQFQDHWDLDAENFGEMFEKATAKTSNLLASGYTYPRAMIINFAKADDEGTRAMFRNLSDVSKDIAIRVETFQTDAETMRRKYDDGTWKNHFQSTGAISAYLWLMFPNKYYAYRWEIYKNVAKELAANYSIKRDGSVQTLTDGFRMYDEICNTISRDEDLLQLVQQVLTDECYPDPTFKTLTIDFGHYVGRYYQSEKQSQSGEGWMPKNYKSSITIEEWIELLGNTMIFTVDSLKIMKRMKDYGGQATCTQLAVKYGETANFYNTVSSSLAQRVAKAKGLSMVEIQPGEEAWWPIIFLGKKAEKDDEGVFLWRLRDELSAALDQVDMTTIDLSETKQIANGYWWLTANPKIWSFADLRIGEEQSYTLYNDNGNKRRIFQNFLDAKAGDIVIGYEANPIKKIVAIGRITQENDGKVICFEKTEGLSVPIEYSVLKEAPELNKMEFFVQPNGSLFKLTKGEYDFIMDIVREENPLRQMDIANPRYTKADFLSKVYMTEERFDVLMALLKNKKNIILQGAPGVGKTFTARKLAYAMMGEVDDSRIEMVQFHQNYSYEDFVMGYRPNGADFKLTDGIFYRFCQTAGNDPDPNRAYFFIIDEINRGNMSKIFGELLMLIDKDYRGTKATLAYSGMPFSVPQNLYIIGMMNTADRSLAMIDYALRRRFSFYDMEPGFNSEGFVKYQKSLANETFNELINQIKQLNKDILEDKSLGRGFQIGHSYFCGRERAGDGWMRSVVEFDILPTLNEYWFDEPRMLSKWEKILRGVFDD